MSDTPEPTAEVQTEAIAQKRERIEEITEQLEDGEVSLERAKELHAEGTELLASLRDELDLSDGSVTVRE